MRPLPINQDDIVLRREIEPASGQIVTYYEDANGQPLGLRPTYHHRKAVGSSLNPAWGTPEASGAASWQAPLFQVAATITGTIPPKGEFVHIRVNTIYCGEYSVTQKGTPGSGEVAFRGSNTIVIHAINADGGDHTTALASFSGQTVNVDWLLT